MRHRRPKLQRQVGWLGWRLLSRTVLGLAFLLVLGPFVPVAISAFDSGLPGEQGFQGFTIDWFSIALTRPDFQSGLIVSVKVAGGAAAVALLIGVASAFAMTRGPRWARGATFAGFVMSPVVIPQFLISLAMLQLLSVMGVRLGIAGLIAVHGAFISPFVVRAISASLADQGGVYEWAAMSLGADRLKVLRTVTLPLIRPALGAAVIIAFTLSFVNVPLSLFLAPSGARTLPIIMFQELEFSLSPVLAALAVLLAIPITGAVLFIERIFKVRVLT